MISLAKNFLTGSCPPLITPFRDGQVDFETYGRLIEHQIANGTHGILVNGTTAEPLTLTMDERNELVRFAVKAAKGRVTVVAQTGSQSHADSVALTEAATKAGADAILVLAPYFIRPPQRGVVEYFADLGRRTDKPLLMYNIPGRSAFKVEIDTLVRIVDKAPNFVGIKHALDDHNFVTEMIQALGQEFRIFAGLEEFTFSMMAIGAQGTMNAIANVVPKKIAEMCNAANAGNFTRAREVHFETYELMRAIFFETNPIPMKYMMKRIGLIPRNEHRLPMVPATPEIEKRLDAVLARAGLI